MIRYKEYYIAVLLNVIAAFIFKFVQPFTWSVFFALISIPLFLIPILIVLRFRTVGIFNTDVKRVRSNTFRKCLNKAKTSVDFLATWGGSIPSLSEYTEQRFKELVGKGVQFRFLLLEPGSEGEDKRKKTRGGWESGQPEADLRWFLNIKKSLGASSNCFKVAVYDFEPVWSMVIVDKSFASVGYYGRGIGRDNPAVTVRKKGEVPSFLEAFTMQYERIWERAHKLLTIRDLDTLMEKVRRRRRVGLVYAITGPSGVGKTTLCQELLKRNYGKSIKTITTRPVREPKEPNGMYEHVTTEQFTEYKDKGELLSYTEFCINLYGIRRSEVYDVIEAGDNLILDTIIEPIKLRQALGKNVVVVFLEPESIEVLETRIRSSRPAVSEKDLSERMKKAQEQLESKHTSDYLLRSEESIDETLGKIIFIIDNVNESKQSYNDLFPSNLSIYRAKKETN